jgi:hypothetical protein
MQGDPAAARPRVERPADELGPVVDDDRRRRPAAFDDAIEDPRDAEAADRRVDLDREATRA